MEKAYFPLFVDISEKSILVVGGGKIAARRANTLLAFAEKITVIAPALEEELELAVKQGRIKWIRRKWEESDIAGQDLVLAVTDDREVNDQIWKLCRGPGILVNVADDKDKCDFFFPGIIRQDDVVIGISSGGKAPGLVKKIREKLAVLM